MVKKTISLRDLHMQSEDSQLSNIFLGFQNYVPIYWEFVT